MVRDAVATEREAVGQRQLTAKGHRAVLHLLRAESTHTSVHVETESCSGGWQHAVYVLQQAVKPVMSRESSRESAVCLCVCLCVYVYVACCCLLLFLWLLSVCFSPYMSFNVQTRGQMTEKIQFEHNNTTDN